MESNNSKPVILEQFMVTLFHFQYGIRFFKKHQLLRGLGEYGWLSKIALIAALVTGFRLTNSMFDLFSKASFRSPTDTVNSMGMVVSQMWIDGSHWIWDGSMKYIILVFGEVIVFHCCRKTLSICTGVPLPATFKHFIHAQVRMMKVVLLCFVLERFLVTLLETGISVVPFGGKMVVGIAEFIISSYLLGFAIIDNYHELYGLTIKESEAQARLVAGVALAIGVMLSLVLLVPIVGAIVGPILASITSTLVLNAISEVPRTYSPVVLQ